MQLKHETEMSAAGKEEKKKNNPAHEMYSEGSSTSDRWGTGADWGTGQRSGPEFPLSLRRQIRIHLDAGVL